jgi:phosphatidylserine/phosphatidylglycerophosphate/cardiolipin synthase-like enzyme
MAAYFAELHHRVSQMRDGDLLIFADWRGDPDERLTETPDTGIGTVFADAARRGVDVRGLVWRSHGDRLAFSAAENRHLGEEINAAGGQCLLDMRVRTGGSHHQKFVVLRHRERAELDVAFLGGIDLCHGRRDDASHRGESQRQPMAAAYGSRPPWHDVQLAISGPAVGDVETVFVNDGRTPRLSAEARCAGLRTASGTTTPRGRRCRHSRPTQDQSGIIRYSCCAPIRAAQVATRSHLRESEAWRAATPRPSTRGGI